MLGVFIFILCNYSSYSAYKAATGYSLIFRDDFVLSSIANKLKLNSNSRLNTAKLYSSTIGNLFYFAKPSIVVTG